MTTELERAVIAAAVAWAEEMAHPVTRPEEIKAVIERLHDAVADYCASAGTATTEGT